MRWRQTSRVHLYVGVKGGSETSGLDVIEQREETKEGKRCTRGAGGGRGQGGCQEEERDLANGGKRRDRGLVVRSII